MQDFIHDTIYYHLLWRLLFLFGGEYVKLIKADCRIFVKAKIAFGFIAMENTNASKVAEGGPKPRDKNRCDDAFMFGISSIS